MKPLLGDGLGTSVDETVAEFMIFFALGIGFAGYRAVRGRSLKGKPKWLGPMLLLLAVTTLVSAFILPQRYLRPKVARIRPVATARFEIISPESGVVVSETLELEFRLEGARLITQATTRLRSDEGHIHVAIDGKLQGLTYGLSPKIDISGLDPGGHMLTAEFMAGDHAPFSPRLARSISFVVRRR